VESVTPLLVINTDKNNARATKVPASAMRYTLRASELPGTRVELNGKVLELGRDDAMPAVAGTLTAAGDVSFESVSITFLALPDAANNACR
jgi:heparanase 1